MRDAGRDRPDRKWPANPYLTPATERVLRRMRDEDLELDHVPEESFWYLDTDRVHPATANHLLGYVLISGQHATERGDVGHFTINEDGRGCLDDPNYVPRMVRAMASRRTAAE